MRHFELNFSALNIFDLPLFLCLKNYKIVFTLKKLMNELENFTSIKSFKTQYTIKLF